MYLHRKLDLKTLLANKSFFLFGPRATGKTRLIKHQLEGNAVIINLLNTEIFFKLQSKPWEIEAIINAHTPKPNLIVIDEIQKIPELLDEVHRLIEEKQYKFLLTRSSARSLKRRSVNLLAGRAWEANLLPLTMQEIPDFSLHKYLKFGGLPPVWLSQYPEEELIAYVNTYLKEEIQAEALVRKLNSFTRFLETAALTSGKILKFSEISNDIGVPATTVRSYYKILEDTLIGYMLPAWVKTKKRKALSTAKFFLFDIGVRNQLAQIKNIEPKTDAFGQAFEHFIAMELRAYLSYNRVHLPLSYWCAKHGQEVDFIIGDDIAIEVKASKHISSKHLKGLNALQEENICKQYFLVSLDPINQLKNNIHIIHYKDFLNKMWANTLFEV